MISRFLATCLFVGIMFLPSVGQDLSMKPHILYFNDSTYSYVHAFDIKDRQEIIFQDTAGGELKKTHIDSIVFLVNNPRYRASLEQRKKASKVTEEYENAVKGIFKKHRRR
jgi:hypothetical protein